MSTHNTLSAGAPGEGVDDHYARIAGPGARPAKHQKSSFRSKKRTAKIEKIVVTTIIAIASVAIFIPILFLAGGSLYSKETIRTNPPSIIPSESYRVDVDGVESFVYNLTVDGRERQLVVVDKKGSTWTYADPDNLKDRYDLPAAHPDQRATRVALHFENFPTALTQTPFGTYILNTLFIMLFVTVGTVGSSIMVAYAFARFNFKGLKVMFLILLSTVMLPTQVVLIPTFIMFTKIGWYDTFLPLIVPAFFANAWDVFLLRQFFMTLPTELDDAARIDGCGHMRILRHVILPQSAPVILTVALFTMIYVWNDFFNPLIYIKTPELYTVAVGLQNFSGLYFNKSHLQSAGALLMLLPPIVVFFIAQKSFIQGTVVSGVKG